MIIHGRTSEEVRQGLVPRGHTKVRIAGIWKTLVRLAETEPSPPNVVFIHPPLYRDHVEGTSCVAGILYPTIDSDTALVREAPAGSNTIHVTKPSGFRVGDFVRIGGDDPWREEIAIVQDVKSGLRLSTSLLYAHRDGTPVQEMFADWEDQETTLQQKCYRGTSTLFVQDVVTMRATERLRIGNEVHRLNIYETESNDLGFYQLPPLQRVGQVELEASADGKKSVVKFQPDFSLFRNQVDFVLKNSQSSDSAEENYA